MTGVMAAVPDRLLQWRQTTGADRWEERWEGVLHMPPAPNREHQDFLFALNVWLDVHWAGPDLLADECPGPVDVSGSEAIHLARLRCDPRDPHALAFWIAFDELRKGIGANVIATLEIALRDLA